MNITISSIAARYTSPKVFRFLVALFATLTAGAVFAFCLNLAGLVSYGWVALISAAVLLYSACLGTAVISMEVSRQPKLNTANFSKSGIVRILYGIFLAISLIWFVSIYLSKAGIVPEVWPVVAAVILLLYALCVAAAMFGRGLELLVKGQKTDLKV